MCVSHAARDTKGQERKILKYDINNIVSLGGRDSAKLMKIRLFEGGLAFVVMVLIVFSAPANMLSADNNKVGQSELTPISNHSVLVSSSVSAPSRTGGAMMSIDSNATNSTSMVAPNYASSGNTNAVVSNANPAINVDSNSAAQTSTNTIPASCSGCSSSGSSQTTVCGTSCNPPTSQPIPIATTTPPQPVGVPSCGQCGENEGETDRVHACPMDCAN